MEQKFNANYEAPGVEVLEIQLESVIAMSNEGYGNEDF